MADFDKIIYTRRSIRKFLDQPVEAKIIENLLKAALLAPSGKAIYPCEFIVVDDILTLEALSNAKTTGATFIKNAPLAIVVVADTSKNDIWIEDASIAATYIMIAAENQNLGCCWVQFRNRRDANGQSSTDNLRQTLNLKPIHEVVAVLAVGYKNEIKSACDYNTLDYLKIHHNKIET